MSMTYKVIDEVYPSRGYFFNGKYIQFQNYRATVEPSIAYRMSRISNFYKKEFNILPQPSMPFNKDSWHKDKRLILFSNIASGSGFGYVTESVLLALLKLGINVINPGSISGDFTHGGEHVDKEVEKSLYQVIQPDCIEIQYCQPQSIKDDIVERIFSYSMFETTHMPRSWVKKLNKIERVLVPSRWLIDSWKEQGVKIPIDVFHHGVNPNQYHYMDRPVNREKYTFVQYGELDLRKGSDVVFRAFADEFKNEKKDVQLILKTNKAGIMGVPFEHPNVTIIHCSLYSREEIQQITEESEKPVVYIRSSPYSKEQMKELLFNADCFVFPSRGEGFGLPGLEALATGLPTITTDWSGMVDYSNPEDTLIVEHTMIHSDQFDFIYRDHFEKGENSGDWAEPSYEMVRKYMRWCYEHREEAKAMGKKAAERISKYFTWNYVVQNELLPFLDKV